MVTLIEIFLAYGFGTSLLVMCRGIVRKRKGFVHPEIVQDTAKIESYILLTGTLLTMATLPLDGILILGNHSNAATYTFMFLAISFSSFMSLLLRKKRIYYVLSNDARYSISKFDIIDDILAGILIFAIFFTIYIPMHALLT